MGESSDIPREEGNPRGDSRFRPSSPLTHEVLEKVRQRDPDALGILFDQYFGAIYGVALMMMRDRAAAEDITQEVFLRVYKGAHQLDVNRNPKPWLMTITANLCREKWRSREGRQDKQTASLDTKPEMVSQLTNGAVGPDGKLEAKDRARLVREAMEELPENMRLVVSLHFQELNYQEIAEILDVSEEVVRKRYSRALKKMRENFPDGLI